ncbi:hypothetical protein AB0K74_41175 [Streptomyces sp. NPDC056159]|uniref:hypothetical protein n=1 Tax=Streptomyces sp. NPDC056159 TaxID=3155537 RepID=UPI0034470027
MAPLQGELTLSFLTRLAARYHLTIRDLLAAVTDVGGLHNLTGMLYPDSEIHLNTQARTRVSVLCRVPPQVLERALPAWTREEPCGKYEAGPVGRLMRGEEAVTASARPAPPAPPPAPDAACPHAGIWRPRSGSAHATGTGSCTYPAPAACPYPSAGARR